MPFITSILFIVGLCSLGLPGLSGFVAEMTVFVGSWQNAGTFYRIATIAAAASIVVTAVYILRAVGQTAMGPVKNEYLPLKDAGWNERLAAETDDRLAMCRLAVANDPLFEVSDIEIKRSGPNYTLDTARELRLAGWNSSAFTNGYEGAAVHSFRRSGGRVERIQHNDAVPACFQCSRGGQLRFRW